MTATEAVRQMLQPYWRLLQVFDTCTLGFRQVPYEALSVKGSLVSGEVDQYSDLDFELIFESQEKARRHTPDVAAVVKSGGQLLAHFAATHIGEMNLFVFFLEVASFVVKVDVDVVLTSQVDRHAKRAVLDDRVGIFATSDDSTDDLQKVYTKMTDLHAKFSGWLWYTYAKLARGELREGNSSLDFMREHALVPCLQIAADLPMEGYRRLDKRLTIDQATEFDRTFPDNRSRPALVDALLRMADLFASLQPRVAEVLGRDHRRADLETMIRLIHKIEAGELD